MLLEKRICLCNACYIIIAPNTSYPDLPNLWYGMIWYLMYVWVEWIVVVTLIALVLKLVIQHSIQSTYDLSLKVQVFQNKAVTWKNTPVKTHIGRYSFKNNNVIVVAQCSAK